MAAADAILRKWLAPALVGGAAATQSEDSDAMFLGLAAKGANKAGAKAAHDVFTEHMEISPSIFTDFDTLIESGAMQADAARKAGNSRQGWFIGADGKPRSFTLDGRSITIGVEVTLRALDKREMVALFHGGHRGETQTAQVDLHDYDMEKSSDA